MTAARLAWRTPFGAMLWEFWGRHKAHFRWHGAALAIMLAVAHWFTAVASPIPRTVLPLTSLICFLGAYLDLLTCFAYVEVSVGNAATGYPARLLLKPLPTLQLVLVPMLFGGLITSLVFITWMKCVLKPMGLFPTMDVGWTAAVALSFFWWMQALSWGQPSIKLNSVLLVTLVVIHFLVWMLPKMPVEISAFRQWQILIAMQLAAVPVAWLGLRLTRRGTWEGPSRVEGWWSRVHLPRSWGRRAKFGSSFGAQFWLEWRRQGLFLPGMVGAMGCLAIPFMFMILRWEAGGDAPPPIILLALTALLPLLFSTSCGAALAKFNLFGTSRELPVYIAVRPMTNGGFVMAKLVMALASSVLAWLLAVAGLCLCLAVTHQHALFSRHGMVTPVGTVPYLSGCLPLLLMLIIWTWKNLLSGIAAGLTGRLWVTGVFSGWRILSFCGLVAVVVEAKLEEDFQGVLLHWLTAILILCLAAKMAVSAVAFVWGWRRKAITAPAMGWITGCWLLCGLFGAVFAGRASHSLNLPNLTIWMGLGAFLIFPVTDLAVAPLALAWNRHR